MNSKNAILRLNIDSGRLSHAYIAGAEQTDTLAMVAVCSGHGDAKPCMCCSNCDKASRRIHPDITFVDKQADKREIVVDQIRKLKKDIIAVPTESEKKVCIINKADLLNINSQNALLQILEEPPAYAVFILSTETPAALLPTVRSRCMEIKARTDSEEPDSSAREMADELFSAMGTGNIALAALMFRLEKLDKDAFGEFLGAAREQAAKRLGISSASAAGNPRKALALVERTLGRAAEMLDLNVSVGHISGLICATLIDKSEDLF